ncbi:N-acetylglucosamine-6-phosphate deacetylase [Sphaerotilus mobilis]|uniref:N-acetylglucosamine 6-phosphate deacetylase n=1 Tax=Sphaerotilus mobilis TaxID=47994 RepID=A0A4Q7LKX4_9BURK|nr:N-acetylglucosamine-6-phosphate deacetylase [Sphaerotilus mobilis]RZS54793.1 N-acetylglucosamine 6-phosphate deacetylase [Sphaerotilus mobilis]
MSHALEHLDGDILTPGGLLRGRIAWRDGHIAAITGQPVDAPAGDAPLILPGFVDLHVHGGGGHDVMDGANHADAAAEIARCHARHGTTALLATTMTAPMDEIRAALIALAPHVRQRPAGGARILGVHLEGPYISPGRLGAQPDFARALTLAEVRELHALAPLVTITLAPEVDGHLDLIAALRAAGHRVQLGHSNARYEDGVAALRCGAVSFTHLFNAMSALHHREPGLVGAALAHAAHAEIIPDLLHVHPGAIHAARRAIPGLYCVSDATAATGMPDGDFRLGRHTVRKCEGGVRLADGTLAGSALTLDQALRNLVAIGLPLVEASMRVSTHAADLIGRPDLGRLAVGACADLVVLDPQPLTVQQVLIGGRTP